ncbi:LysR family transcriptional regulator, partial [Syntrophomonas zehnderi]
MNLRQLELFSLVAEIGSVTKAAKQVYMSQPAVSQAITDLEDKLQVRLFERMNHRMLLTSAGETLYQYSKRILSLMEEAENTMQDIANIRMGKLRVGASTTIGIYLLPHLLGDFQTQYENVELQFFIDNTSVIEDMVMDNTIDIGLVEGPIHSKDITVNHLLVDKLFLICSPKHRWALENKKSIKLAELVDEVLIFRESGSGTREVIENALSNHKVKYKPKHVLNNTEAIKNAVIANIGIAFLPQVVVENDIRAGHLIQVDIEDIV